MKNTIMLIIALAFLTQLSLSTLIITSGKIQQYNIGQGKTMIVYGDDIEDQSSSEDIQEKQKASGTIEVSKKIKASSNSQAQTAQSANTQKSQTATIMTKTQTYQKTSSSSIQTHKRISFYSSFGSLGKRSDEETYRNLVLQRNKKWMQQQNKQVQFTFKMGENQFSLLTVEQFASLYLNLHKPSNVPSFQFDLMKEIKKFRKETDDFIDQFFGFNSGKSKKKDNKKNQTVPNSTPSNSPSINPIPVPVKPSPTPLPLPLPSPSPSSTPSISPTSPSTTPSVLPKSTVVLNIDWVASGFVTSVKDQGSCGSCYSFASQASIQSAFLMKNSTLHSKIDLSQQQIIDCSSSQGNSGCNGGWLTNVYNYVISYGTTTETNYPYTQVASSCKSNGGSYKISNYQGGALSNCSALAAMVSGRPLSIAVTAGNAYWQNYAGGILNVCGSGSIDHGVLLVGVYQDSTQNYWKVRNSWGQTWGEKGFIRIDRSKDNICQICSYGFYPQI